MNTPNYQMKGTQYPFGELPSTPLVSKTLIRKRYYYRNSTEYSTLMEKIDKLKTISHKNTINLRRTDNPTTTHIDLFYPYISLTLEDSYQQNPQQTVKALHKQFIELAIHLAKNCILTSFNPTRCGIILNDNQSQVKYYLPLQEITLTSNVNMLERSVQLFNLQSMHYLDTLAQNAMNSTIENSSQCSFRNRTKLFRESIKARKDSHPASLFYGANRKYSTHHTISPQMRKLSNLSKELSQFTQMHKKRAKPSTKVSVSSSSVFNKVMSLNSEPCLLRIRKCVSVKEEIQVQICKIKERSLAALKGLKKYKEDVMKQKNLVELLKLIKH